MPDRPSTADTDGSREAIVAAALTLLRSTGPSALTVRNITDAAGCSTTGIYTHFGGKSGVIEAIFVDGFESFDAAIGEGLDAGDLLGAGHAYRRWALDHPTQYMVMFGDAIPGYEPSDDAIARASPAFEHLVEGVRRSGVHSDEAARTWAYHLFATVHGYVMLELSSVSSTMLVDGAEQQYDLALASLMNGRPEV